MILFTVDTLNKRGYNLKYEFEDVDKYLQICKELQENTPKVGSSKLLAELMEDIGYFDYKEIYIFFEIKNVDAFEYIYIYDYADLEYIIEDSKENFAKVKVEDAIKLIGFQLSE
ncbi:hypothetical protein [Fusobacterium gastrosuis]|uniref:hypothetical protein n=1 Tax=Fusobacterium gastrosuis TaxID=1755100 RepID=UPI00297B2E3C|nr:hypothetical protein [Fusobacteriaceae bacterium]MDY5713616.1 hypothetical protein [Fusobacterium gastrosuis]